MALPSLDNAEGVLKKVDSILSAIKDILKKHWGVILIILIIAFFYFAITEEEIVHDYHDENHHEHFEHHEHN